MGIKIQCILQRDLPDVPHLDGKSLAVAYCSTPGEVVAEAAAETNVIAVDFGGPKGLLPVPGTESSSRLLLTPLDPFMADSQDFQWHEAAAGLVAVRQILRELGEGIKVAADPDLELDGYDGELTDGVRWDLEQLEQVLAIAHEARCGFYLAFET